LRSCRRFEAHRRTSWRLAACRTYFLVDVIRCKENN
jgi:hypothetical protein